METINDLFAQTESLLNTLDKDYEAMTSQKDKLSKDHEELYYDLAEDMGTVLSEYEPKIYELSKRIPSVFDREGSEYTIYQDNTMKYMYTPELYWAVMEDKTCKPYFRINLYSRRIALDRGYCGRTTFMVDSTSPCTAFENLGSTINMDVFKVFLNHKPDLDQLRVAFETALVGFAKEVMSIVQKRNEKLAKEIKESSK